MKRQLSIKRENIEKEEKSEKTATVKPEAEDLSQQLEMHLQEADAWAEDREKYLEQISKKWTTFSGKPVPRMMSLFYSIWNFSDLLMEHHIWMDKLEKLVNGLEACEDPAARRPLLSVQFQLIFPFYQIVLAQSSLFTGASWIYENTEQR